MRDLLFSNFHFNADSFSSRALLAARSPQYHYLGEAAVPHFTSSVYTPYAVSGHSIYRLVGLWVGGLFFGFTLLWSVCGSSVFLPFLSLYPCVNSK